MTKKDEDDPRNYYRSEAKWFTIQSFVTAAICGALAQEHGHPYISYIMMLLGLISMAGLMLF